MSNHAGTMPLDGMVLHAVVYDEIGRHVRMLGADLIFKTPYSHDLARKTGTTLACQEDAERLLASDQLVAVFPEGFKGLGKLYADRYKLQRFGRGGFVSAADPRPGADHPGLDRRVGGDLPADQPPRR